MYNRYIPESAGYAPVEPAEVSQARPGQPAGLLSGLLPGAPGEGDRASRALNGLLKGLHLERLDTGDILLALIVLFLLLEDGDDLDLIITLALTLLLSLGEESCAG